MHIYPKAHQYYMHDVIECQALGYRTPFYQWVYEDSVLSNGSTLVITPSMAGMNGRLVCVAKNDICKIFFLVL